MSVSPCLVDSNHISLTSLIFTVCPLSGGIAGLYSWNFIHIFFRFFCYSCSVSHLCLVICYTLTLISLIFSVCVTVHYLVVLLLVFILEFFFAIIVFL